MFDRVPDATLVADLAAAAAAAAAGATPASATASAVPAGDVAAGVAAGVMDEVVGWQRVAGWVEWHRLDAMRRFEAARVAADCDLAGADDPVGEVSGSRRAAVARLRAGLAQQAGRFAAEEVALALNVSVPSVDRQLGLARALHEVHPQLGEALRAGEVSGFVVSMVAAATARVESGARRLLDEAVTADAVEVPAGAAISAARARAAEADPDADAAAARAAAARRVYLKPLDDAVAVLGAVLPAVDACAAYARLDGAAAAARAGGDPRSLDQLRSDLFTHLLTTPAAEPAAASAGGLPAAPVAPVSPASSRLAAVPDGHGCSVDGAAGGGTDAGIDPAGSAAPSTESMSPAVGSTGRSRGHALVEAGCPPPAPGGGARVQVQVVIALSSLVGLDSRGGDLPGYGTLPAGVVRDLAAADDVTLSRLLCDPDTGTVLQADPSAYVPSAAMRHAIGCRDRRCRMPVCGARIRHLDHIQARVDSGLTTTANLHGLCQRSHLAKHHPAWRVSGDADNTVTWTTPTGRIYTSTPPPATGHGTGPPRPYRRAASRSEADTVP